MFNNRADMYIDKHNGTTVTAMVYKYCAVGNVRMNAFTHGKASNFTVNNNNAYFDLRSNNGVTQVVYSGDWVIQFESGSLMALTNEVFVKNYKIFE